MAGEAPASLPDPPLDFATRRLPLRTISNSFYRIHLKKFPGVYFGRNKSQRFDDPTGEYAVMYAAAKPEGAFAEVFLRQLSLSILSERELQERAVSTVKCKVPLRCVDLTGPGLRKISCDNRISTEIPYETVWKWSRACYNHPDEVDGIIYLSRHNPEWECLALFDRCKASISITNTEDLMIGPRKKWTINQIFRYDLTLEPAF